MRRRTWCIVVAALPVLSLAGAVRGADFTWTGLATIAGQPNALYGAFGNWSPNGAPGENDNVTFASGFASGTAINLAGNASVQSFNVTTNTSFGFEPAQFVTATFLIRNSYSQSGTGTVSFNVPAIMLGVGDPISLTTNGIVAFNGGLSITANRTLRKSGSGNLRIGGTFSGNLNIDQGSATFTSNTSSGTIFIGSAGTLLIDSPITVNHTIISQPGVNSFVRSTGDFTATLANVNLVSGSALHVNAAHPSGRIRISSATFNNAFINATGPGTVEIVSGTGLAFLSNGRLVLPTNSNNIGAILQLGVLELNGNVLLQRMQVLDSVVVEVNGTASINNPLETGTNARFVKTGNGVLFLAGLGVQPFTAEISRGTLDITGTTVAGTDNKTFRLNGGVLQANTPNQVRRVDVGPAGGTIDFRQSGSTAFVSLSGSGHLRLTGPAAAVPPTVELANSSGALDGFTGSITLGLPGADAAVNLRAVQSIPGVPAFPAQPSSITVFGRSNFTAAGDIPRNIAGTGTVTAAGSLAIGVATAQFGFDFDGTLEVGGAAVTLRDLDVVRLGTVTRMAAGGSLSASVPVWLTSGRALTSSGAAFVLAPFINQGTVSAIGGAPLTFAGPVSGTGTFSGPFEVTSTLTPGEPAGVVSAGVLEFGSLQMAEGSSFIADLASTTNYDALQADGAVIISPEVTLEVRLASGFAVPELFSFRLMSADSITGTFESIVLPSELQDRWFVEYTDSEVWLTNVRIIPEPGIAMVMVGIPLVLRRRR